MSNFTTKQAEHLFDITINVSYLRRVIEDFGEVEALDKLENAGLKEELAMNIIHEIMLVDKDKTYIQTSHLEGQGEF